MDDQRIGGKWSQPWLALTTATLNRMRDLRVRGDTLVTIENQTCFEAYVAEGVPDGHVALWTGGFVGEAERLWLRRLIAAGVTRIRHWGDLDAGGLAIMHHIATITEILVEPLRMEPELLDRLRCRPLTEHDRAELHAWLVEEGPLAALAAAMLERGCKLEQEAWYAGGKGRQE